MKKQMLAAAVSCAVLAMVAMPSALAAESGASGEVSSVGDGITFTDASGLGYVVQGTNTSDTLAGAVETCYVDTMGASSAGKYFTVTDTDNVEGHNITIATAEENFSVGAGGSTIPTTALSVSFEGGVSVSECPTTGEDTVADLAEKIAGNATMTVADHLTFAATAYDSSSSVSFMSLSTSPAALVTADNTEAFQYKFRIGAEKITWPQYTKVGTYTATQVLTYNAST